MPQCPTCTRQHRYRKYNGKCKECHVVELKRERHDKVCTKCSNGFVVDGTEKWKTICHRCVHREVPGVYLL